MMRFGSQTPVRRALLGLAYATAGALALWVLAVEMYRVALAAGMLTGFIAAAWFLIAHRPRRWWSVEAINASALPIAMVVLLGRSILLLVLTWPGTPPQSAWQGFFSLGMLAIVDAGCVANLVLFRRFVRGDVRRETVRTERLAALLDQIDERDKVINQLNERLRAQAEERP